MQMDANKLFDDAMEKLNEASEELFRPEEDVVSFAVCKNAQFAIENYLKGYLLNNNIDPSDFKTVESLYERCKSINNKFQEVDLSNFKCKADELESRFCNEVVEVSYCFDVANELDTFLRKEKIIKM